MTFVVNGCSFHRVQTTSRCLAVLDASTPYKYLFSQLQFQFLPSFLHLPLVLFVPSYPAPSALSLRPPPCPATPPATPIATATAASCPPSPWLPPKPPAPMTRSKASRRRASPSTKARRARLRRNHARASNSSVSTPIVFSSSRPWEAARFVHPGMSGCLLVLENRILLRCPIPRIMLSSLKVLMIRCILRIGR